jgi:hypothetical protein
MQFVVSGLDRQVSIRTEVATELSCSAASDDAKLRDGVRRGFESKAGIHVVNVTGSIDEKIVGLGPETIDGVGLTCSQSSACFRQPLGERSGSRLKNPQLREIPSIERQIEDLTSRSHFSQGVADSFYQRRI